MSVDETAWHFLVNPAAGRGKALLRWQKLLPRLKEALPGMTVAESTAKTGMAALAESAVRAGNTRIVGAGGDGTHHDILNGIIASGGLGRVIYAPLPLGTGNDWVRSLNTPRQLDQWLAMLKKEKTIPHRIGVLNYVANLSNTGNASKTNNASIVSNVPPLPWRGVGGEDKTTHFLNITGLAYDAEVVRRSETARYKHRFLYPFLTLLYLKDFIPPAVRIDYDGQTFTGPVHTINLGIGRYSGGGMRLVPQADPTADTLALTFARRLPVWKIVLESWRFYTGTVGRITGVTTTHAKSISITPVTGSLEMEADGEWLGRGRVAAGLLDECLRVVV